jgi:hypothetical protein
MEPLGADLDEDQARRVDALLEPAVEILGPMLGESGLVADQLGAGFDGDEKGLEAERSRLALIAEADPGIALDVGDGPGVAAGEEEGVAVELDVLVVAHRPAGDGTAFRAGGKDREIHLAHLLRKLGEAQIGHEAAPFSGSQP